MQLGREIIPVRTDDAESRLKRLLQRGSMQPYHENMWHKKQGRGLSTRDQCTSSEEEIHKHRILFNMLDTDGDNSITQEELFDAFLLCDIVKSKSDFLRLIPNLCANENFTFPQFLSLLATQRDTGDNQNLVQAILAFSRRKNIGGVRCFFLAFLFVVA